jgi:ABC-type antimicrobial peptide transport system permease subunit
MANYTSVSADYFTTLKIPLVAGQLLPRRTTKGAPLQVVINEAMARRYWPGGNAIGKRTGSADPGNTDWYEVIGVVRDVKPFGNLGVTDTDLQTYVLLDAFPTPYVTIALRSTMDPKMLTASLRDVVASLDPDLPVYNVRMADDTQARGFRNFELTQQLLSGFGILGLLLAAVGLYGVISGLVVRRTAEFGIRLALGAQPADVLRLVMGGGARLAAIGAALGLVGSFALQRLCMAMLPGLPGNDTLLLAATALALFGIALFACWLPARRATQIDPIIALRSE